MEQPQDGARAHPKDGAREQPKDSAHEQDFKLGRDALFGIALAAGSRWAKPTEEV